MDYHQIIRQHALEEVTFEADVFLLTKAKAQTLKAKAEPVPTPVPPPESRPQPLPWSDPSLTVPRYMSF